MLTPQQIQEVVFEKALFGGYDMESVDDFLEPLTTDYVTLYKENSVLKSKMRILVEKLEEYRKQESSMQSALLAAQKTGEQMIAQTQEKCAEMMREAAAKVSETVKDVDVLADKEQQRLEAAREATAKFIDREKDRLRRQLEILEQLREEQPEKEQREDATPARPAPSDAAHRAYDFNSEDAPTADEKADAIIEEIGSSIGEAFGGGQEQKDPDAADTQKLESLQDVYVTGAYKKFEDLQFGKNYDPQKGQS